MPKIASKVFNIREVWNPVCCCGNQNFDAHTSYHLCWATLKFNNFDSGSKLQWLIHLWFFIFQTRMDLILFCPTLMIPRLTSPLTAWMCWLAQVGVLLTMCSTIIINHLVMLGTVVFETMYVDHWMQKYKMTSILRVAYKHSFISHIFAQILALKLGVRLYLQKYLFWKLTSMLWDHKSGPLLILSSSWFLLYLRNLVPIEMESPFHCKVACNVVCSW